MQTHVLNHCSVQNFRLLQGQVESKLLCSLDVRRKVCCCDCDVRSTCSRECADKGQVQRQFPTPTISLREHSHTWSQRQRDRYHTQRLRTIHTIWIICRSSSFERSSHDFPTLPILPVENPIRLNSHLECLYTSTTGTLCAPEQSSNVSSCTIEMCARLCTIQRRFSSGSHSPMSVRSIRTVSKNPCLDALAHSHPCAASSWTMFTPFHTRRYGDLKAMYS